MVSRCWYLSVDERRLVEMGSVIRSSSLDAELLDHNGLSDLYVACLSGMGLGHRQDFFQAIEKPVDLEFNLRFASVYGVNNWPRRVSPSFEDGPVSLGVRGKTGMARQY